MFTETFAVRFYETDALQHVSNTALAGWFEAGRQPIFKMFVPDMNLDNWPLIIASYKIDFLAQIYLQHEVTIKTWVKRVGNSSFELHQECWQQEQVKSRGVTTMVHFDYDSERSVAIPEHIKEALGKHLLDTSSM
jgi:acyl-CoA thioester hydrolase